MRYVIKEKIKKYSENLYKYEYFRFMVKDQLITVIYAYRNRDALRVELSLQSLKSQNNKGFEVVFVDYGSDDAYAQAVEKVVTLFDFANYHYIGHPGLLWNKSKALNYGIRHANGTYIFIADVDIIFHRNTIELFQEIANPKIAFLFVLSYLSKKVTQSLTIINNFFDVPYKHNGKVNGMILSSKNNLFKINGFDEFFHFYGSEDVDLYQRLEFNGIQLIQRPEKYFLHQWHVIYNSYDDSILSLVPRLYNIKRINQEHYFYHKKFKIVKPIFSKDWGNVIPKNRITALFQPDKILNLDNHHAKVIHFLKVELPAFKNGVIKLEVRLDINQNSFKNKLKRFIKKESQPSISIKEVNDQILTDIINTYRDYNYHFSIHNDFKGVTFIIQK